jgi:thiamine-monophosphate kinase
MIDISDGLAADLGHVLDASTVGAEVDAEAIPLADGVTLDRALGGGDDYELCFTAPDGGRIVATFAAAGLGPPIRIGTITATDRVLVRQGRRQPLPTAGWSHPID